MPRRFGLSFVEQTLQKTLRWILGSEGRSLKPRPGVPIPKNQLLPVHDKDATMNPHLIASLTIALLSASHGAWAGRPLASDDAGTAEAGTCQLESWVERAGSENALVLAPACGIAKDLELGADYTLPRTRGVVRAGAGIAFKWVPQTWRVGTPAGELNFGVKLGAAFEHPAAAGWRTAEIGALALATLAASDSWSWHANLGAVRERSSGTTAALLNLALVWTPRDEALLFLETQANNRRDVFGGTVNTVGGRWWLVKDSFGVDLTASREAGAGSGTSWTMGFGWYGLGF